MLVECVANLKQGIKENVYVEKFNEYWAWCWLFLLLLRGYFDTLLLTHFSFFGYFLSILLYRILVQETKLKALLFWVLEIELSFLLHSLNLIHIQNWDMNKIFNIHKLHFYFDLCMSQSFSNKYFRIFPE